MSFATLSYNGLTLQPASTWFTIERRGHVGPTGRRNLLTELWHIRGRVSGANTSVVTGLMAELEAAMVDGGDIVFSIFHFLRSADCTEGTHIYQGLTWLPGYEAPRGSGAELVNRREFSVTIGGTRVLETDTDVYSWYESYSSLGTGGPRIIPSTSLAGTVQAQQIVAATPIWTVQQGKGIYLSGPGLASIPVWLGVPGVYYDPDSFLYKPSTPIKYGINENLMYPVEWNYRCWSNTLLVGAEAVPILPF